MCSVRKATRPLELSDFNQHRESTSSLSTTTSFDIAIGEVTAKALLSEDTMFHKAFVLTFSMHSMS